VDLRLQPALVASLGRVGLKTIGCIASLPRAPLAARFGAGLMQRLDQALGREDGSHLASYAGGGTLHRTPLRGSGDPS
jgi:nucleotidyltransferase/DNA polymerase involved in DNA repair